MFLKQTSYKPRSNSQSSQGSAAQQAAASSPPKEEAVKPTTATGPVSAAAAGRRRSSAGNAQFAGLNGYKRKSQDESAEARKASWQDQKPGQSGILGNLWNSYTKGS